MDATAGLARLDTASGYRLTIIIDPEGQKKDAALESWASHPAFPLAWMRLDPTDNDPMRFFPRLQACLRDTKLFSTTPPQTHENPVWEDYLIKPFNEAVDISEDFFLILDDYHFISSPEIHQPMGWLLDFIPDRMHLLITSRKPLPLPIPRLRLRHQLLEIDLS